MDTISDREAENDRTCEPEPKLKIAALVEIQHDAAPSWPLPTGSQQLGMPGGRLAEAVVEDFGIEAEAAAKPAVPAADPEGVDPAIVGEEADPVVTEPAEDSLIAPDVAAL